MFGAAAGDETSSGRQEKISREKDRLPTGQIGFV